MVEHKNISIIWDFDKTLTPMDSTTELLKLFLPEADLKDFWKDVKEYSDVGSKEPTNSISTSEAPVWMYLLSEIAQVEHSKNITRLDYNNLKKFISHKIQFYPNVLTFLKQTKNFQYEKNNVEIHHFIITAGLKDLVKAVFNYQDSPKLITEFFGCKYKAIKIKKTNTIKNIPIYCMDKTAKTRALFEISKGCFLPEAKYKVDDLVPKNKLWCPFENMIYIGDGDTDIPAFSLVKSQSGLSIGVFDPNLSPSERDKKTKNIRKGKRIDLFTPVDFSLKGELYKFITTRCLQIVKRYEAHAIKFR